MRSISSLLCVCGLLALSNLVFAAPKREEDTYTNILIGGGTLAALAAALTAVNITMTSDNKDTRRRIVLLEPTDWPGGQLTASNVPPDFGAENFVQANLPSSFVQLLMAVAGPDWESNPGACWVSYKCFEAQPTAIYIQQWLEGLSDFLTVHYNTVIKSATRDADTGRIISVSAIKRTPKHGATGWEHLLSTNVHDWYDPEESEEFYKEEIVFNGFDAVIEATEWGDIMVTAGLDFAQGVEYPEETSNQQDSNCGQSTVIPFYISYLNTKASVPDPVPIGSDGGSPYSFDGLSWNESWTYRRALGEDLASPFSVAPGEVSNQNSDNDYTLGYLFISKEDTLAEANDKTGWKGGLNLTSLSAAEQRGFGYYHYVVDQSGESIRSYLAMNFEQVGTGHGLAKVPYIRDTRRIRKGLDNFTLLYSHLSVPDPLGDGATAYHFEDTIGIGTYLYADIHGLTDPYPCENGYPDYITCCEHPVIPYYIPFRALAPADSSNLLVAGKGMAQSFLANAGTRFHPEEWVSGTAAGAAAYLMTANVDTWTQGTRDVLDNIGVLQKLLLSDAVKSPLTWTLSNTTLDV